MIYHFILFVDQSLKYHFFSVFKKEYLALRFHHLILLISRDAKKKNSQGCSFGEYVVAFFHQTFFALKWHKRILLRDQRSSVFLFFLFFLYFFKSTAVMKTKLFKWDFVAIWNLFFVPGIIQFDYFYTKICKPRILKQNYKRVVGKS